jgi:surface carbohydrate biosynthesis protein
MNIYLHVEVSSRELDSKLLLAVIAAERGHQVIVSNLSDIINGLKMRFLSPGIFHTKSLTPGKVKIDRHQNLIDSGNLITSIDEESGITTPGYNEMVKMRYSEKTINQASAIFGWGEEDTEILKKTYTKCSYKIHKTGSPRADLWRSELSNFWIKPKSIPQRPYLLISSNFINNHMKPFHEIIRFYRKAGYLDRDPNMEGFLIKEMSEEYNRFGYFLNAIKYLSSNNNGYDIVVRPHQSENVEAWRVFLEGLPNVHVVREGSITPWIRNCFAVMHNSCTSAFEGEFMGKPVITFVPFKQKYERVLPNMLGSRVENNDELLKKANLFFDESITSKNNKENQLNDIMLDKIHFDKEELAAEKIIKVWESLDNKNLSSSVNWIKFEYFLKFMEIRGKFFNWIKKVVLFRSNSSTINHKFPDLDKKDIYDRVKRFKTILGINKKIECKLLSKKTILIKSA